MRLTAAIVLISCLMYSSANAQLIYQEGFNDDGDGTRYTIGGRGSGVFGDGPAAWDHNFDVAEIGLADTAPAKRAAILWSEAPEPFLYTQDAFDVFYNLVDWSIDGKANANIAITSGAFPPPPTADELLFGLEDLGHTVTTIGFDAAAIPNPLPDLIIQTAEAGIDPATLYTDLAVPVITFNAGNHDDILISSIGQAVIVDPPQVTIEQDHPIVDGKNGTIDWMTEPTSLQGIGQNVSPDAQVLATYSFDGQTFPALVIIEEGDALLGAWNPVPEGEGYILGGDLNADFGGGGSPELPRTVELNPVDVSGFDDVKLTVALAASNVDFEDPDFLRISIDPNNSGSFEIVADFLPVNAALTDGTTTLSPDFFQDVSIDVPSSATDLVVLIEAYSTFPNEIVGIDNIRITSGDVQPPLCGDFDMDGDVDSADRTIQTTNWTGALPPGDPGATKTFAEGDCDGDGDVDTADQNGTITNWTGAMNAGNLVDGDDADLLYDPVTGNVKLDASDTSSGMLISFVLGTGENSMRPENLVKSSDGSAGPFFDVGTNTDAKTFQIGQTDPLNQGAGPVIDLGDVFPAGIADIDALAEYLTLAEYASELGQGGTLDLIYVPEPSSLVLALIGMLSLVSRRRRK